ncbi:MAG: PmoA family protein [Acidobacteriia bacterium]|nr:PmoA family protein [Terriglobia bacterium]
MRITNLMLGLAAAALPALAQGPFAWKDTGNGHLELTENGKPALVYNYGAQLKEGAPENRKRCCYFFPVYSPAGVSMLDDFPRDHWHHRGLFWSWPVVEAGGKTYDLWMQMTVRQHAPKMPVTAGGSQGKLVTRNFWEADGKDIVKEDVVLTAFPSQGSARELELDLTWEALGAPVTLRGSREAGKSYGGVSARFAAREDTVIRADGQTLAKDEDLNPRRWAELEGTYGGKRVAFRITPDAGDQGVPYQWCLRNYGFIGASFPGRTETGDGYTLQPGKPLRLKFRVRVADL